MDYYKSSNLKLVDQCKFHNYHHNPRIHQCRFQEHQTLQAQSLRHRPRREFQKNQHSSNKKDDMLKLAKTHLHKRKNSNCRIIHWCKEYPLK